MHRHIAEENLLAADRMVERILSSVESLALYPQLGRTGRVDGTRELVIAGTNYLVAYRVRGDQNVVLSVLHAARKWPEEF